MTLVTAYLTRRSAAERRVFLLARTVFFRAMFSSARILPGYHASRNHARKPVTHRLGFRLEGCQAEHS